MMIFFSLFLYLVLFIYLVFFRSLSPSHFLFSFRIPTEHQKKKKHHYTLFMWFNKCFSHKRIMWTHTAATQSPPKIIFNRNIINQYTYLHIKSLSNFNVHSFILMIWFWFKMKWNEGNEHTTKNMKKKEGKRKKKKTQITVSHR